MGKRKTPARPGAQTTKSLQNIFHEVAEEKLADLKKQESSILTHYEPALKSAKDKSKTQYEVLELLADAIRSGPQYHSSSELIKDLQVFLKNSKDNQTIHSELIQVWIDKVKQEIEFSVQKATHSNMYGTLFEEWIAKSASAGAGTGGSSPTTSHNDDLDEKKQAVEDLTKMIFTKPTDFNKSALLTFLNNDLFGIDRNERFKRILEDIIQKTKDFCKAEAFEITPKLTVATIKGLHSNNLFSKEKQDALLNLIGNKDAIAEIAGILTDRIHNFAHWKWPSTVNVNMAKGISGHYRAFMDEDTLTAIFLQLVGVQWGVHFKSNKRELYNSELWKRPGQFGVKATSSSIEQRRQDFHSSVFLSTLPDAFESQSNVSPYDNDEIEQQCYNQNKTKRMAPFQLKQKIVHVINTEVRLNEVVNPDGALTIVQTDMEWFGPSLVHEAILTILEYFGVTPEWLGFFERFLRAPICIEGRKVQTRERGVPINHSLSLLFGEINLFLVDLLVNRTTGQNLYRLYDDFWFWSRNTKNLSKAWTGIQTLCKMVGLTINVGKSGSIVTGSEKVVSEYNKGNKSIEKREIFGAGNLPQNSVRWGFLKLYSHGGFQLDRESMTPYVTKMTQLLDTSTSVLGWINVYNNYMRFFVRNCGRPTRVMGRHHIEEMIDALKTIHRNVFIDGNPVMSVKVKFPKTLDGVLHSWIYWPMTWGGLEMINPFLDLLPLFQSYEAEEDDNYFYLMPIQDKRDWEIAQEVIRVRNSQAAVYAKTDTETFAAYCKRREIDNYKWEQRYNHLMESLESKCPPSGTDVSIQKWGRISERNVCREAWLNSTFGPEIRQRFGSPYIVDAKFIPVTLVSLLKKTKIVT